MISRFISPQTWARPVNTQDSYGQAVSTTTPLGTIDIAIYFDSQVSIENPLCVDATHIGLTKEKSVERMDIIGDYEVLQVNPIGRLNQLVLKLAR